MRLPIYDRKGRVVDHVIVDHDIAEMLGDRRLLRHNLGYTGYQEHRKDGKGPWVLLHRLVTDVPKGMHVHHINGNRLDNRRSNLQVLTPGDHMRLHARLRREAKLAAAA